jgi:hypothetical protein
LYIIVNTGYEKSGEFSFERQRCKDELIEFVMENSWFGASVLAKKQVLFADIGNEAFFVLKTDEPKIAPHVKLWLASYGESAKGKLRHTSSASVCVPHRARGTSALSSDTNLFRSVLLLSAAGVISILL